MRCVWCFQRWCISISCPCYLLSLLLSSICQRQCWQWWQAIVLQKDQWEYNPPLHDTCQLCLLRCCAPPHPQNLQKLCNELKCLGSWRIKHLTQKSTSYLTLLLTLCKIHKNLKVFIHCTESSSDLCKQVYRVAFAYMSMSSLKCICVIQMCAVDTVSAL